VASEALVLRSRIVLACAEGASNVRVGAQLACTRPQWASGEAGLLAAVWKGSSTSRAQARRKRSPTTMSSRLW
jgi:hypothetical protein